MREGGKILMEGRKLVACGHVLVIDVWYIKFVAFGPSPLIKSLLRVHSTNVLLGWVVH